MGMFDLDEDLIPLIQSSRGNAHLIQQILEFNKIFQTPILYTRTRVSFSLNHSMTIIHNPVRRHAPGQGWHIGGILPITDMPILICHN